MVNDILSHAALLNYVRVVRQHTAVDSHQDLLSCRAERLEMGGTRVLEEALNSIDCKACKAAFAIKAIKLKKAGRQINTDL